MRIGIGLFFFLLPGRVHAALDRDWIWRTEEKQVVETGNIG